MADEIVSNLLDSAYKVNEEINERYEKRDAIRKSLRNLKTAGALNAEQAKEVDQLFPKVNRKPKADDKGAGK